MVLGFYYPHGASSEWRERLVACLPGIQFRDWPGWEPCEEVDYALVWSPPADLLPQCTRLKAVISAGAGIDHLLPQAASLPDGVPVVRMADAGLVSGMTEYVLMNVLLHHRRHADYVKSQHHRQWRKRDAVLAQHRRIGFMGLGNMARPSADILLNMGFPVCSWTRSRKTGTRIVSFAGDTELHEFLANTDIVVALLPLTGQTTGLLNSDTLSSLPEGAAVINAGRGKTLIETDLIQALDSGRLSGASLDVFADEPLSCDSPLWRHPRVFVTPHVASPTIAESAAVYVLEVIGQIESGRLPAHVADLSRGY